MVNISARQADDTGSSPVCSSRKNMEHWCNGNISACRAEVVGSNPICSSRKMEHWCRWLTYLPAKQMTPVQVRYVPPEKIWSIGVMVTYPPAVRRLSVRIRYALPEKYGALV